MAQVLPMRNLRLSRIHAFQWHGVTLKYPGLGRSGLRHDDGVAVFAMPVSAVRVNDWGCSCPLWLPPDRVAASAMECAVSAEQLGHCKLAVQRGGAEGFLLYADDRTDGNQALTLRVSRLDGGYWAHWGGVARRELPGRCVPLSAVAL